MKTVQSPRFSGFFCVAGRGLRGLVLMAASLGVVGAAAEETQPTRLTWTTYASEAMPALDLQATQLRLVMFRPDGGPAPDVPAGVFVNGRLLSSLLPGGFADAVVCRHSWRVQARTASQASALLEPTVPTERELFVRVQVQDDGLVLQPVTVPEFLAQSQSLRRQNHVVSRLAPVGDCQRGETRYTLASELLFQFGKHGIEDLLRMGEHEIVKLARKIREEHSLIEHVQVVGHTDPMGTRELNLALSGSRAQTVANVLLGAGLPADKLKAVGVADDQLIVPGCDTKKLPRAELLACNQANRRVEVVVKGTRRAPQ